MGTSPLFRGSSSRLPVGVPFRCPDIKPDDRASYGHARRYRFAIPVSSEVAVHSAAMEGLAVTPATRADAAEYAAGAIDVDELIGRVDARHRIG